MYDDTVHAKLYFSEPVWASGNISPLARQLIEGLLRAEPSERLSAKDVLAHEWLQEGVAKDASLSSSLAYLRRFQVNRRLKPACLHSRGSMP